MKVFYWFISSMMVALLYIYLLAIQHVRGEPIHFSSTATNRLAEPLTGKSLSVDFNYHNYDSLTKFLHEANRRFPHLTYLYSIGKSTQGTFLLLTFSLFCFQFINFNIFFCGEIFSINKGRELWVLMITKEPEKEILLKPNVKYVGNIHGNEV